MATKSRSERLGLTPGGRRIARLDGEDRAPATRPPRRPPPLAAGVANLILAGLAQRTRFVDPALIVQWPRLVGADISRICRPGRFTSATARSGRTLEVHVADGAAAALVQFRQDELVDRLNGYFGKGVVARLLIRQGTGAVETAADPTPPPDRPRGLSGGLSRFRGAD